MEQGVRRPLPATCLAESTTTMTTPPTHQRHTPSPGGLLAKATELQKTLERVGGREPPLHISPAEWREGALQSAPAGLRMARRQRPVVHQRFQASGCLCRRRRLPPFWADLGSCLVVYSSYICRPVCIKQHLKMCWFFNGTYFKTPLLISTICKKQNVSSHCFFFIYNCRWINR